MNGNLPSNYGRTSPPAKTPRNIEGHLVSENEDCVRLASPRSLLALSSVNEQRIALREAIWHNIFPYEKDIGFLQAIRSYKIANCIGSADGHTK